MPLFPPAGTPSLGWVNVKDHGAKGDGTTNDTAAITAAIAALPSTGGVLYFPTGTYVTSGGFTIGVPCAVRGDGGFLDYNLISTTTKVTCTSATANLFTVTARFASFEDIALINTSGTTPTAGSAVHVTAVVDISQKVDYHSITVAGFYIGIDSTAGWGWVLTDSLLTNCVHYCIRIQNVSSADSGDWVLDNCSFLTDAHATDAAVYILGSGGGRISNCKTTNGDAAINFIDSIDVIPGPGINTSDLLIDNCSFENAGGTHIYVDMSVNSTLWANIVIVGNQLYNSTDGIHVNGYTTANPLHMVIANNVITHTFARDISQINLINCNDVVVSGNVTDTNYATVAYTSCVNITNIGSHGMKNSPALAAGANNGTTPPAPTLSADSTDSKGTVSFGSGTGPAAGAQAVLTWGNNWGLAPKVFLTPLNAATAALGLYVSSVGATSSFTISAANAPSAGQVASTYQVQYFVVE